MSVLTPTQIAALTAAYKIYRFKGRLQRKMLEAIFFAATGKKLGKMYYAIPIVNQLMELSDG